MKNNEGQKNPIEIRNASKLEYAFKDGLIGFIKEDNGELKNFKNPSDASDYVYKRMKSIKANMFDVEETKKYPQEPSSETSVNVMVNGDKDRYRLHVEFIVAPGKRLLIRKIEVRDIQ